jgi:hypothetical protein
VTGAVILSSPGLGEVDGLGRAQVFCVPRGTARKRGSHVFELFAAPVAGGKGDACAAAFCLAVAALDDQASWGWGEAAAPSLRDAEEGVGVAGLA